ncbi:MAG: hemin receptor [Anaerolineaceae bacterium]|nr:hemin receptor [Anaerolineaceae bacterium]
MSQANQMTPEQVDLVQTTFKQVLVNATETGDRFYDHLFALAPELRPLFTNNIHHQGDKFLAALAILIFSLERHADRPPFINHLGLRHTHHGIPQATYRFAGQALLQTLAEMLGPVYTPDVAQAWGKLFDCLTLAMTSD